jgi:putative membrane protein
MNSFTRLLYTWLLLAAGVLAAAHLVPGISYDSLASLVIVVLLLSLLNAFLKPILLLFTLPFIVLTMGIGVLFINAFLFLIVGRLVEGFYVAGFGSAFVGGLIISILTFIINSLFSGRVRTRKGGRTSRKRFHDRDDDVIDI